MSGSTSFVTVGTNPARVFGMAADDRARALAAKAGLRPVEGTVAGAGTIYANLAYAWDPAWLSHLSATPGAVLVKDGRPVLAHIAPDADATALVAAMGQDTAVDTGDLECIDADTAELTNELLRKRERPFVLRLDAEDTELVERASYDASYKGVTDALTLYLWRKPAFYLTRWAALAGISPNQVTLVGFLFCIAAFYLFWTGWYWSGVATGFVFMVLDTVDGKLARCTGQSSEWGNILDHGVDLVHPPFWWWAWAHGLAAVGRPIEPVLEMLVLGIIVGGYVLQRLIEGAFLYRYKMHIHVWRRIDSQFRLITARRNPNMVILVAALAIGRPDLGLEWVAAWTLISLIFHWVRLVQANARRDRGRPVTSWLA
ncbi:CDP-alcohol phosphatidyltransferase family protein [Sphingomonas jaspsi]|uniref:CDP-alcohol phosphatidyltransferase family protein n=1 Tax=Sphingomonas jaspsi TaxID=392409 RepID=UPI0004AC6907|nr:CDP-alcohol phosphatidyltransferase family protein [Sphingomonas jaspsi]